MKYLATAIMLLALSACATVHQGADNNQTKGDAIPGLVVSGTELNENPRESFAMIALTFENQGEEWLRFDKIEVLIDEDAAKFISVVQGKDLLDWASAMESRARMEQHNREITQATLIALGAATAAIANHNNNTAATGLGAAAMAGGYGWAMSDAFRYRLDWAQNPKAVPSEHVTTPFAVPGKMFLKRWVLLNKPVSKSVRVLPLAIHTVDGRKQVVMVKL